MKTELELLKTYFGNKDRIKAIKVERIEYMESHACEIKGKPYVSYDASGEGDYDQRADCLNEPIDVKDYCPTCMQRHNFYREMQKLSHANSGIMTQLRTIVKQAK